ncbi:hypothetical protein TWF730_009034 [Orbilia blumenaviensis]|uniref:F-box domain-containing protein n=1 Tax=Orbilia blumenaviensis TaxID=1796055 RepID=A0AAV9UYE0_9PEZI
MAPASLPLEIQYTILSFSTWPQHPTLRCVCKAWAAFLSAPAVVVGKRYTPMFTTDKSGDFGYPTKSGNLSVRFPLTRIHRLITSLSHFVLDKESNTWVPCMTYRNSEEDEGKKDNSWDYYPLPVKDFHGDFLLYPFKADPAIIAAETAEFRRIARRSAITNEEDRRHKGEAPIPWFILYTSQADDEERNLYVQLGNPTANGWNSMTVGQFLDSLIRKLSQRKGRALVGTKVVQSGIVRVGTTVRAGRRFDNILDSKGFCVSLAREDRNMKRGSDETWKGD